MNRTLAPTSKNGRATQTLVKRLADIPDVSPPAGDGLEEATP